MIVYQATKAEFLQHAWRDDIDEIVERHFVAATGHGAGPSERLAWRNSLIEMAKVLGDERITLTPDSSVHTYRPIILESEGETEEFRVIAELLSVIGATGS